jgi:tetratricopeptide (TPR) repeat protein
MNRILHALSNVSNVVIVGLWLAVLPCLVTISVYSRTCTSEVAKSFLPGGNSAGAQSSAPGLLPCGGYMRCLSAVRDSRPAQTGDYRIRQVDTRDSADGPILAEPLQSNKNPPAYIPSIGLVAEDNFDGTTSKPSPPVWMPREMPIVEKSVSSSSWPKKSNALANAAAPSINTSSSAFSTQDTAVAEQEETVSADQQYIYPSTTSVVARREASSKLPVRSEQLESIAQQADRLTRHGFELAGRGAYFAARSEFIAALRLVAQGLDTAESTKDHGKSLASGLTALKEVDDFIPGGSRLEADLDLQCIIANHTTAVLKQVDKNQITSLSAIKSYMTYAQERLAEAVGNETAGSMALHALGKLHEELAKGKGIAVKAPWPKAIAFYQASLLACPNNFMAANDLGVLLARNGDYENARKMLEHSCSISRQSTIWQNLSMVYGRLGYQQNAWHAQQQALIARQNEQVSQQSKLAGTNNQVRWVDENAFAGNTNQSATPQSPRPTLATQNYQTAQQPQVAASAAQPSTTMQPRANSWAQNTNVDQSQSASAGQLPSMRPATTGWLQTAPYETRR